MEFIDGRRDARYWHARHVFRRIEARHREEMARALTVTPQEFADYVDGRSSPRISDAVAEGRIVLVRDAGPPDAGSNG